MRAAVAEAEMGLSEGGIFIGSVLVHGGRIIGRGHNRRVQRGSVRGVWRSTCFRTRRAFGS